MKNLLFGLLMAANLSVFAGANDVAQPAGACAEMSLSGNTYDLRMVGLNVGTMKFKSGESANDLKVKVSVKFAIRILDPDTASGLESITRAKFSESEEGECQITLNNSDESDPDTFPIVKIDADNYTLVSGDDSIFLER